MRCRLLSGVEALAAVDRHDRLVPHHDADVPALVRLLDVAEPLLDGHLPLAVAHPHLLLHAPVAVVALGGVLPLVVVDGPPVPEGEPSVELALLRVLLGVVPRAPRVGHRDGELHRRRHAPRQEARDGLHAEEAPHKDGRADDEHSGSNHLPERGVGGNLDARLVVGLDERLPLGPGLLPLVEVEARRVAQPGDLGPLAGHLLDHGVGGLPDRLHGEGREPVGHHGAEDEAAKDDGGEEVDARRRERLVRAHRGRGARDKGAEEGEGYEGGRADGEALADGGGGVAGGVERVSLVADVAGELGHLGDASGVVGDGAVDVDGEAGGEVGEHAEGGERDAVHAGRLEGEEDDDGDDDDGEDARVVAKREAIDDVGGCARLRGARHFADGRVRVRRVILGDEADQAAAPEARDDAQEAHEGRDDVVRDACHAHLLGERPLSDGVERDRHDHAGEAQLDLEGLLDVGLAANGLDVGGDKGAGEARHDADAGDEEGVREGEPPLLLDVDARGPDEHRGARRLPEGPEQVGPHARHVAHVVADVVGDAGGVEGGVLVELLAVADANDLAGEIGADVGGLGEDASADAAEHGDGGAAEAVAGEALEEHLVVDEGLSAHLDAEVRLVEDSEDVQDDHRDGAEAEAHDPPRAEGGVERGHPARLALLLGGDGGAGVCVDGHHHADEARQDRRQAPHHEGRRREPARVKVPRGPPGAVGVGVRDQGEDDDSKHGDEEEADLVLRPQEGAGAGADRLVDRLELVVGGARGGEE
mmetsp:Transcript_23301/g.58399  ORF Transcript_23301/g.58399 Transcript_23301/m.58399 type:complete len:762 (-) Transcript_23301:280-2565(-)